jgi:hypothetical protein
MTDDHSTESDPHADQEHPEQEAHGGSMAPGLVDDTGRQTTDVPATDVPATEPAEPAE